MCLMTFLDSPPTELEYNPSVQPIPTSTTSFANQPEYTDTNSLPMYRPYNHFPHPNYANPPVFNSYDPQSDRPYKSAFHPVIRTSNASIESSTMRSYAPEANYYNPANPNVTSNDSYYHSSTNETDYNSTVNNYYYGQSQMPTPYNNVNYNDTTNNYLSPEFASIAPSIDTCPFDLPPKQKQTIGEFDVEENLHKTVIESSKTNNGTTFVCIFLLNMYFEHFHKQMNYLFHRWSNGECGLGCAVTKCQTSRNINSAGFKDEPRHNDVTAKQP